MALRIARVQTDDRLINQLQSNIALALEPPFKNLSGTFIGTLTGCTTTPSALIRWQQNVAAGTVTMVFPDLTGTSNSAVATINGLPAALYPANDQTMIARITNNSTVGIGVITVDTKGAITLYKDAVPNAFTSSGTKGVRRTTVTYAVV